MTPAPLVATTYLLATETVTDLDDFAAHHEKYLVDIAVEPARAVDIWRERQRRGQVPSDGFVSLRYHGVELFGPRLWDETLGIWWSLVDLCDAFRAHGRASTLFPDQPLELTLRVTRGSTLFGVAGTLHRVESGEFVPGLLRAARDYFAWVHEVVGDDQSDALRRIDALLTRGEPAGA
ncbi:hypothetical protein JT358_08800 [Micrococcales bacterium 31B]|nr:hypothetical protein [Micrococcales bacterium 31B]